MKQLVTMSQLTPHRYLGGFIPGMVAVGVPQLVLPPGSLDCAPQRCWWCITRPRSGHGEYLFNHVHVSGRPVVGLKPALRAEQCPAEL